MNVVDKANQAHKRQTKDEPGILKSEECGIEPYSEQEYDATTAQHNARMRATHIRFIDDVEFVGYAKVCQL